MTGSITPETLFDECAASIRLRKAVRRFSDGRFGVGTRVTLRMLAEHISLDQLVGRKNVGIVTICELADLLEGVGLRLAGMERLPSKTHRASYWREVRWALEELRRKNAVPGIDGNHLLLHYAIEVCHARDLGKVPPLRPY